MPSDVPANAGDLGQHGDVRGLTNAVADSRSHRVFSAPTIISANQLMTALMMLVGQPVAHVSPRSSPCTTASRIGARTARA